MTDDRERALEAARILDDWWWPDMAKDPARTERLVRLVARALLAEALVPDKQPPSPSQELLS
jgi:hypothetical protein